jgi:hypothetical protein
MRSAVVVSGNLRTFLMPIDGQSLAQLFVQHIVEPNNADVFMFTDTNDFYLDGVQYFATDRRIEVLNKDASRLHDKIDFVDSSVARDLITARLQSICPNLKRLSVEDPFDARTDPKFDRLESANIKGNNPALLIHQARKTKLAYELLKQHELDTKAKYDVVLRWRFDNTVSGHFDFASYDFTHHDLYVPGIHSPVIYDWFALGTRAAIDKCLSLYDAIGLFLDDGRMYICSKCKYHGSDSQHKCMHDSEVFEITLSVEYHLFRIFQAHGIRLCNARYQSCPYRYRKPGTSFDALMERLNLDATVVRYTPGVEVHETRYQKK